MANRSCRLAAWAVVAGLLLAAPAAVAAGDAVANLEAYAAYKMGRFAEARERWEELAARGNTTAMINLANLYEQGQGVPVDAARAGAYTRDAAEAGDPRAQYQLAMAYERGAGVPHDLDAAAHWLERAARQGEVDAQFALGVLLATGQGAGSAAATPDEIAAARTWLDRADAAGHPEAADYLAGLKAE